jgi:hypothetical protein
MASHLWRPGRVTRIALIAVLALPVAALAVTAAALAYERALPDWFTAAFACATILLALTAVSYARAVWGLRAIGLAGADGICVATVLVATASFLCTSSLHSFYPFRPSVFQRFEGVPWGWFPPRPLLYFNFALTAFGFTAAALLAIVYLTGARAAALTGMVILALAVLIPNDNCSNPLNRPWLQLIGASPLMFATNAMVLGIATCGLCGLWRRSSLAIITMLCLATLLTGIGHMTGLLW